MTKVSGNGAILAPLGGMFKVSSLVKTEGYCPLRMLALPFLSDTNTPISFKRGNTACVLLFRYDGSPNLLQIEFIQLSAIIHVGDVFCIISVGFPNLILAFRT